MGFEEPGRADVGSVAVQHGAGAGSDQGAGSEEKRLQAAMDQLLDAARASGIEPGQLR